MAKLTVLFFTLILSVVSSEPESIHFNPLSAEPDPDSTNPTLPGSESGSELISPDEVTIPVNFMNFHPINRHFPRRPLTTVLFNRRPCHHHHRHELLGQGLQIPYGNDMIFSDEEKATVRDRFSATIKMLVGPLASEKTKHNPDREINNPGEVETEENGYMKITVSRVKLIKRKEEGEGEKEHMFRTKIRKFLNHLV